MICSYDLLESVATEVAPAVTFSFDASATFSVPEMLSVDASTEFSVPGRLSAFEFDAAEQPIRLPRSAIVIATAAN